MRIATITKYVYGATVALAVLSGASIVLMNRAVEDERTALADRAEQRQLSFDLTNASDYLTREARLYTIFGDQKHADNYWGEVNETKTRDRVVTRLQELGLPEEELALVEQAKANSDALIDLERAALQTVADGDLDLARYLMYGEEYDAAKELVAAPIIAFRSKLIERTDAAVDDAQGLAAAMSWLVTGIVAAAMLGFLAILHFVLSRRAVAPMVRMGDVVSRLAEGDFSTEVPEQARQDEVGDMARAVQVLKESGQERARLEAEQARDRAQKEERQAAIEALISDFDRSATEALKAVSTASQGLGQTANAMTALAEQTSEQAVLSAAAAEETSANVQSVSASTEEMGASIREIARQIGQASSIAGDAKSRSDQSVTTVRELDAAVQSIGDVVKLITDIAEQTNLLALNATIEAARAGDAGKGFAVVASEVKNLATETARATDEIVKQIASVQGATKDTITVIDSIGLTISEINEISAAIAAAIEQQNAATEEIARNVQEAARGTQDVSENVGRVREATTETGAAAAQVLDASGEVDRQAETIRQRVERFLTGIRAA